MQSDEGGSSSTVRSIAERILQSPMSEGIDIRLSGPGPRIEAHYKSLEFLAMPGGMIEGVTSWFQSLRQAHSDLSVPCFEAERYLPEDVLSSNGYTLENGTAAQGRLRALDSMRKAGWALYHLAQNCSLDEFRHVGCHPNLEGIFKMRGPMMQIALSQQDTDTANMYYAAVTEFADSIEKLESTFGVGFLLHSLNTSGVSKEQSEEAWEASAFALSDKLHSGEMIQALHGFVIRGVFELDQAEKTTYRKYWCESE